MKRAAAFVTAFCTKLLLSVIDTTAQWFMLKFSANSKIYFAGPLFGPDTGVCLVRTGLLNFQEEKKDSEAP